MYFNAHLQDSTGVSQDAGPGQALMNTSIYDQVSYNGGMTLPARALLDGYFQISGQTGGYNVYFPCVADFIAQQPNLSTGDSWEFSIINNQAFAATANLREGILLGNNVNIPASSVRRYLATVLSAGPRTAFVGYGISGSPVITGIQQGVLSNIEPGMTINMSTVVGAPAQILAVSASRGEITVNTNIVAASHGFVDTSFCPITGVLSPTIRIQGLYSATL